MQGTVAQQSRLPSRIRLTLISLFGTMVEYYDYSLYGYAAVVMAQVFFPESVVATSYFKTFIVFAFGAAAKPLGAIFFSRIGDTRGRSHVLKMTMPGIAVPTFIIAILPGYASIGVAAPIILLLCRFAQGFFVAGEADAARITLYETVFTHRPLLSSTVITMASFMGIFAAARIMHLLDDNIASETWRIPFLIGGMAGLLVFYLRRHIYESDDFERFKEKKKQQKSDQPSHSLKLHAFIPGMLICGSVGGIYHIFFIFLPPFLSGMTQVFEQNTIQMMIDFTLLGYIIGLSLCSITPPSVRPEHILFTGCALAFSLLAFIVQMDSISDINFGLLLPLGICFGLTQSPGYIMLMRKFDVGQRFRGVSLSHTLGSVLLSGSAPALCTKLWSIWPTTLLPLYFLMTYQVLMVIGVVMLLRLKLPTDAKVSSSDPAHAPG